MSEEYFILVAITVTSIASIFYIPPKSYRLALVSLLAFQVASWPIPIILMQIGYTDFPVREFVRATRINFIGLYLFIPMVFAWFMLLFPQNASILRKVIHYFLFVSFCAWFVYYISTYTELEEFLTGTTLFTILFLYLRHLVFFIVCHLFIKWFSKKTNVLAGGVNA